MNKIQIDEHMIKEAMNLALEALENAWLDASMGKGDVARHTEAITVLREALAEQPAQLPFGVGGGLVAIKTLLSRDPRVHANTAIEMIDAILAEQPAQQPTHCKHKRENNGVCPHHNLQCGWPKCNEPEQSAQQEPVAWLDPWTRNNVTTDYDAYGKHGIPLYTSSPPPAQPQQKPVGVFREDDDVGHVELYPHQQMKLKDGDKLYTTPPAQQQEPVAWLVECGGDSALVRHTEKFPGIFAGNEFIKRPLVFGDPSPPASKPWVGLMDEEIDKTYETQVWDSRRSYARAIEAKLREKNT